MTLVWIIGILLSLLALWMLKNCRTTGSWNGPEDSPVLKVWHIIVISVIAIIPFLGLFLGGTIVVMTSLELGVGGDYKWRSSFEKPSKLFRFLNKTIS